MKLKFFATLLLIFSSAIVGQNTSKYELELFPQGLHFLPLKSNYQEARVGILYYPDNTNLKVDIGNNIDLFLIKFKDTKSKISLSIEFMGYVLSTSYKGSRLQIDALDGFFGGNMAYSKQYHNGRFISRFRIIHNSAHLVDGHYDISNKKWINDDQPIPFTRDFGEITLGYQFYPKFGTLRTYGTLAYSTLVRPTEIKKWSTYFGYELAFDKIIDRVLGKKTNVFLSSQFNFVGTPKYRLNSNFMGGIKFGDWDGKGVVFYLSYYIGANPFSEYYSKRIKKFGIGFFIDFF